jgi:hypothetical protein
MMRIHPFRHALILPEEPSSPAKTCCPVYRTKLFHFCIVHAFPLPFPSFPAYYGVADVASSIGLSSKTVG